MVPEREFNALLVKYTPYIKTQLAKRGVEDREESFQEIALFLCEKRESFDPTRAGFATWAWWVIRDRVNVARKRKAKRRHINFSMEYFPDGEPRYEALSNEGDPHACLELKETLEAITSLPPRSADAVMQRACGVTLGELGRDHGISKQRVQQLRETGLKKLRQAGHA